MSTPPHAAGWIQPGFRPPSPPARRANPYWPVAQTDGGGPTGWTNSNKSGIRTTTIQPAYDAAYVGRRVASISSKVARGRPDSPPPPGARPVTAWRRGMVVVGHALAWF